jgi:hypothetical protein
MHCDLLKFLSPYSQCFIPKIPLVLVASRTGVSCPLWFGGRRPHRGASVIGSFSFPAMILSLFICRLAGGSLMPAPSQEQCKIPTCLIFKVKKTPIRFLLRA